MRRPFWLGLGVVVAGAAALLLVFGFDELTLPGRLVDGLRPEPADTAAAVAEAAGPGVVAPETAAAAAVAADRATRFPPLLVPVAGVRRADLVDTYRQARSEGRRHDAIDIHAPRGTPVVAAAAGTVVQLWESDAGGTMLYKLDPGERIIYYYAHLDGYARGIREGQRVERGDTIGFVGDSGNAQPGDYHLHFGVTVTDDPEQWWGGTPTNPYPLLRDPDGPR